MGLPYEDVVYVALRALRERARELPKDKDILAFCKVSMRGYEAQHILNGAGFDRVSFIKGGLLAWPFEVTKGQVAPYFCEVVQQCPDK